MTENVFYKTLDTALDVTLRDKTNFVQFNKQFLYINLGSITNLSFITGESRTKRQVETCWPFSRSVKIVFIGN